MKTLKTILRYATSYFLKLTVAWYLLALLCSYMVFWGCSLLEQSGLHKASTTVPDESDTKYEQLPEMMPDMSDYIKGRFFTSIFVFYVIIVFCSTVLARKSSETSQLNLDLFWSYRIFFKKGSLDAMLQNIFNMLMMIPVGMLFRPVVGYLNRIGLFHKLNGRKCEKLTKEQSLFLGAMLFGFFFSALIEAAQLVLRRGLCELDDLFHNTLGCVIGFLIYKVLLCYSSHGEN